VCVSETHAASIFRAAGCAEMITIIKTSNLIETLSSLMDLHQQGKMYLHMPTKYEWFCICEVTRVLREKKR
jgi:hypothetical protein